MLKYAMPIFLLLVLSLFAINIYGQNIPALPAKSAWVHADPNNQEMFRQFQQQVTLLENRLAAREQDMQSKIKGLLDQTIKDSIGKLEADIDKQLESHNNKLTNVKADVKANDKALGCHFTVVSVFTGACITIAIAFLGLGFWQAYRKEQVIFKRLNDRVDRKFSDWLVEKTKYLNKQFEDWMSETNKTFKEKVILNETYMRLRSLLELPNPPTKDEIFPLVSLLYTRDEPRIIYRPICDKINKLDLGDEINDLVKKWLQKIEEAHPKL